MRRVLAALLIGVALAGGGAAPAYAHNELTGESPAENSSVDTPPKVVELTFNEPVGKRFGQVAITGPDGKAYAEGGLQVSGNVATQPLKPLGRQGAYVVGWRVVSADGHPISGTYTFWLGPKTGNGASGAGEGAAGSSDGGLPVAAVVMGGVAGAALVIGAVLVVIKRRRNGTG